MSAEKNRAIDIFKFATLVCLICSLVVSTAAVSLRGIQEQNAENEKKINILRAAGLVEAGKKLSSAQIQEKYQEILPLVVNLKTGELNLTKDPKTYDMYAATEDPQESHALSDDPANIKRIAENGSAYVLVKEGQVKRVILPIQGYGLWSTLYGFTAVSFDKTHKQIDGITFYKQGETPGLGALITEPSWQEKWRGVHPYNVHGEPNVVLSKRKNPDKRNEVDAIAGATLTSNGVQYLVNFWLGSQGYKLFLDHLQQGKITVEQMQTVQNSMHSHQQEKNDE